MLDKKSIVLGIGFTNACNMNCNFCYSKNNRKYSFRQPISTWKNFICKNAQFIDSVNYGTGENALEDDWFELVDFISTNYPHITQAVTTNGSLSNILREDRRKEEIFLRSIKEVDVSLDYCDRKKHNSIRGNDHAFEWALDTMDFCNKNNIRLTVVTLGINDTLAISNYSGIFEIASKYNALNRLNIYRKSSELEDDCELDYDILLTALEWVSQNHKIIKISDPLLNAIYGDGDSIIDASGKTSFRIVSDGRIYPSTYLLHEKFVLGNITDENFSFENEKIREFTSLINTPIKCKKCKYEYMCKGGAIDRRYLWYKTFDEQDPYCPYRHQKLKDYKIDVCKDASEFQSVHDGYLPTLFFKGGKV